MNVQFLVNNLFFRQKKLNFDKAQTFELQNCVQNRNSYERILLIKVFDSQKSIFWPSFD